MIILHYHDETSFLVECDIGTHLEIKEHVSCYAANYKFHPRFKARIWNGKISFYDIRGHLYPIGLLPQIYECAKKFNYQVKLNFSVDKLSNIVPDVEIDEFAEKIFKEDFVLRDYQFNAIKASLENKRGVCLSATASGKSAMIYTIFRYLTERLGKKKTMLIVPNTSLVEQMFSDFIDYGWLDINKHVTKLYAGRKPDFSKPILITTWQSIYKQPESFFKDFDAVLIDECQSAKSMSISSVMKKCKKADYRLGFTGTLPTEKADEMNIKSSLGPVIFELKSKELIDKGVLSMIYIANILLRYPEEVVAVQKGRSYPEEVRFIETYTNRNKAFDFVFSHIKDKQNTLILCNHLEHLSQMETYLKTNLDKKYIIYIISGEIKTQEREDIRRLMEKGENLILLASYGTMSAGVNIKRIHNVIFASSSKSKIRVLQSIGRGLRKHESKDCVVLWDLIDDLTYEKRTGSLSKNYMYQHWEERIKFYDDQGFKHHTKTIHV
jgi:superfamily II DNA or RNA helicase